MKKETFTQEIRQRIIEYKKQNDEIIKWFEEEYDSGSHQDTVREKEDIARDVCARMAELEWILKTYFSLLSVEKEKQVLTDYQDWYNKKYGGVVMVSDYWIEQFITGL